LIATAGVSLIVKSIASFFDPSDLTHLDIGLGIVAVSGIINFDMGFFIQKVGKKHHSLTLIADGQHLKTDAYSSVGVIIGLVVIMLTGWQVLDSIIAIIFGVFIGYTGIKLIRKSIAGIMDEADETLIVEIIELLNEHPKENWIDIYNLRVVQYGSIIHIDCHTTLPWYFQLEAAHNEIEEIAAIINEKYGRQVEFFIHGDPCIPQSCKICQISDCKVRQEAFGEKMIWDLANVRRNQKHLPAGKY
jgi:cation diffusion facilitator family transporter